METKNAMKHTLPNSTVFVWPVPYAGIHKAISGTHAVAAMDSCFALLSMAFRLYGLLRGGHALGEGDPS